MRGCHVVWLNAKNDASRMLNENAYNRQLSADEAMNTQETVIFSRECIFMHFDFLSLGVSKDKLAVLTTSI